MGKLVGVAGQVTSYFEWRIPDFSSHAAAKGLYINSPLFSLRYCKWKFRLYPKGNRENGWISLYLEKEDADPPVDNFKFSLAMRKSDGTLKRVEAEWDSTKTTGDWGFPKFLEEDELLKSKSEQASSDPVTIICCMEREENPEEVVQGSAENMPEKASGTDPVGVISELETLSSDYCQFFASKEKCDVIIRVQDEEFQAHKAVLMARSPVFRAMFSHDTKEAQEGVVNEPDCDPESFGDFLQYLYTGKLEDLQFRNAHQLYITSDKYDTQKLKSCCVSNMERNITVENFCVVADLGDRFEEVRLASAAQTYFNQNFSDILETDEWMNLMRKNCLLANTLFREMGKAMKSKK